MEDTDSLVTRMELANDGSKVSKTTTGTIRNLVAFWFLGLCNNFAYVIMLSAAHDILETQPDQASDIEPSEALLNLTNATIMTSKYDCNSVSTGAVLLADILPTLFIKLAAPWFADYTPYGGRVAICIVAAISSFLIVAFSHVVSLSLFGVVMASISAGLGEFTFISLMTFYSKNVVSTWSSGTGAAGLIGSLSYAGLIEAGLSARHSLLVMLVVPFAMAISYWCVLLRVPTILPLQDSTPSHTEADDTECLIRHEETECHKKVHLTMRERLLYYKHLTKYMIPLSLVYFAEYFINQGLMELIYFEGIWLTHSSQYRWFQVLYQLGVFISRSSVNIVQFKRLWVFSLLQWCVLVVMLTTTYYSYIPSIFIIFGIILFEGLLGGAAYVNTFYQIRKNEEPKYKEFAMGTTTVAESVGVALSGAVAIPVHDAFCRL